MRDFNLKAALRGDKVVTKNELNVTDIQIDYKYEDYPILGTMHFADNSEAVYCFTFQGNLFNYKNSKYDLRMADEEPKTIQPEPTEPSITKTLFSTISMLVEKNVQFDIKTEFNEIFINLYYKTYNGFFYTEKYRGSTELLGLAEPEIVRIIEMLFSNLLNKISTTQTS